MTSLTPYFQEDGITIYHGDAQDLLPFLPEFDLLLTDPPYGLNMANDLWNSQRGKLAPSDWDLAPIDQRTIQRLRAICQTQIIWGGNYYSLPPSRCWLSWFKPDAPPSMANVEYAWTNLNKNSRMISQSIAATNAERVGHPTQKPLRVITWSMQQAPNPTSLLDPFMGSGTSLLAAKQRGLSAVGIDLDESYCDIAIQRLSQRILIPC